MLCPLVKQSNLRYGWMQVQILAISNTSVIGMSLIIKSTYPAIDDKGPGGDSMFSKDPISTLAVILANSVPFCRLERFWVAAGVVDSCAGGEW